jgi:hypothetical protein
MRFEQLTEIQAILLLCHAATPYRRLPQRVNEREINGL